MSTDNVQVSKKSSTKTKLVLISFIMFILFAVASYASFMYFSFKVRAEGIALGYSHAASAAFQMGRALPNNIFEEGNYRVEVISSPAMPGQPFTMTINVRDKYTNITHHTYTNTISPANTSNQMENK